MFKTSFITYSEYNKSAFDLFVRNNCVKNYVEIIKWNDLKKNVCEVVCLFLKITLENEKENLINFLNLLWNKMI